MSYRTPFAAALDGLIEELVAARSDDALQGEEWIHAVMDLLVATPMIWPIPCTLWEALLAWAGFDLQDANSLQAALWVTRMLDGTEFCPRTCDHTEHDRSPLCGLLASTEAIELHIDGQAARFTERCQALLERRTARALLLTINPNGGHRDAA